jgi:hypothetical protein
MVCDGQAFDQKLWMRPKTPSSRIALRTRLGNDCRRASASAGVLSFTWRQIEGVSKKSLSVQHPSHHQARWPSAWPWNAGHLRARLRVCCRTAAGVKRSVDPFQSQLGSPSANIASRVFDTLGDHRTWLPSLPLAGGSLRLSATGACCCSYPVMGESLRLCMGDS